MDARHINLAVERLLHEAEEEIGDNITVSDTDLTRMSNAIGSCVDDLPPEDEDTAELLERAAEILQALAAGKQVFLDVGDQEALPPEEEDVAGQQGLVSPGSGGPY